MPILVSAVFIFFASFFTHMVFPHHKSEFLKLPNEDAVMESLSSILPSRYMFPRPESMKDIKSPEYDAKAAKGPNGLLVIYSGPHNMGQNLMLTFLFYLLVGVFVGYLGWHAISAGSAFADRFRFCAVAAFAAHGLGWMSYFIWFKYGKFWPNFFDSVGYALITGATFAWLWPQSIVV